VFVGEDADDIGASLDLADEALDGVGRMQLRSMSGRESRVAQHVGLGLIHQRDTLVELVGHSTSGPEAL
jgi:hypothetical protein